MMLEKDRLGKIMFFLKKKYKRIRYMARGKRSVVYLLNNDYVVKIQRDDISARKVVEKEYYFLKKLSKYRFFPKIISYNKKLKYLVMNYVKGVPLRSVKDLRIYLKVLEICRVLDMEGVNQTEMNNPYKHVIVSKNDVYMIDFERAVESEKVHNVSQFLSYVLRKINVDRKELILLAKKYNRKHITMEAFENHIKYLIKNHQTN